MATGTLSGKVALITGAGSTIGMGRVMALALGAAGARVAMMDVDAASLEASAGDVREIAGDAAVLPIVGDISSWDDAQRAVSETIEGLGGLHVLIHHAGIKDFKIHVAGEFFSAEYIDAWSEIVHECSDVSFFTYTRSWRRKEFVPALQQLAGHANIQLWLSCDQATGQPPSTAFHKFRDYAARSFAANGFPV